MADWIQAIGVVISLLIAGIRYYQVKKNTALESVKQMLNLLDEFDILVDDNFRFKVSESVVTDKKEMIADYQYMQQEVITYEAEFRNDLKELWRNMSAASFVMFNREAKGNTANSVSDTLNNAAVVQRQLKNVLHAVQQNEMGDIQKIKNMAAKSLLVFAKDLTQLAVKEKLVHDDETLSQLYSSLAYYVGPNREIIKLIEKYLDQEKKSVTTITELYDAKSDEIKKTLPITPVQKQLYQAVYTQKNHYIKVDSEKYKEQREEHDCKALIRNAAKSYYLIGQKSGLQVSRKGNSFIFEKEIKTPKKAKKVSKE